MEFREGDDAEMFSSGAIAPVKEREIGGELIQTINARDVHRKLQVGRVFSTWIKDRAFSHALGQLTS
jgi:hypothetical protein